jgi:hypothetical protein
MPPTAHCHISGLLQLNCIPDSLQDAVINCSACIHGVSLNVDDNCIFVTLTYFNNLREEFVNNAVVFCSGTLLIAERPTGNPELSIKAQILVRYVIADAELLSYLINIYQVPRRSTKFQLF